MTQKEENMSFLEIDGFNLKSIDSGSGKVFVQFVVEA